MTRNSAIRSLVLAAALAVSVPAFAKPMVKSVALSGQTRVGQSSLQAGQYNFRFDGNHLTVQRNNKVVAESEGRWEQRTVKPENTQVVTGEDGKILEIRLAGKADVFVLAQ